MAAKTYLRSTTTTRLASEIQRTVADMRKVQEDLIRLSDVLGQIALDGDDELMEKIGFDNIEDAQEVKALLSSAKGEILADPFYQQTISRMG